MSQVLFLCTGNYYRSRYAEILFNFHAATLALPVRADSRGLMVDVYGHYNLGPMAAEAAARLRARGIDCPTMVRPPRQLAEDDLTRAELIVALKELEHRPMVLERFPAWHPRIVYWHVDDIGDGPVEDALSAIDLEMEALLTRWKTPT